MANFHAGHPSSTPSLTHLRKNVLEHGRVCLFRLFRGQFLQLKHEKPTTNYEKRQNATKERLLQVRISKS